MFGSVWVLIDWKGLHFLLLLDSECMEVVGAHLEL